MWHTHTADIQVSEGEKWGWAAHYTNSTEQEIIRDRNGLKALTFMAMQSKLSVSGPRPRVLCRTVLLTFEMP